ncbi:MAG: hypothetical protein ACUVV3_01275 [Dehalococcoidia bacterium]
MTERGRAWAARRGLAHALMPSGALVGPGFRNLLGAAVLACALLTVQIAQMPAAAGQPVLLDSPGVWTLRDLGYSDIFMPAGAGTLVYTNPQFPPYRYTAPVEYLLPDGAAQGPDIWYVIHFHFEIEFAEDTGDGEVSVYAQPNKAIAAAIDFTAIRGDDSQRVEWQTLSLTEGYQRGASNSRRVEIRLSDYFTNDGVVPGENSLLFSVQEWDEARVAMLHVFDDTAIEVTPRSPPELEVEVDTETWRPAADTGDTFEVPYVVRNRGGWPAKDVVTEVSYPQDSLRLLGEQRVTTPLIDGWQEVSGSFRFQALAPGTYDIVLAVDGAPTGPGNVAVTVTITRSEAVSKVRLALLVAAIVALSALPLLPYGKILAIMRGRR